MICSWLCTTPQLQIIFARHRLVAKQGATSLTIVVSNNHAYAATPMLRTRKVGDGVGGVDAPTTDRLASVKDPRLVCKTSAPKEETIDAESPDGELPVVVLLPVVYSLADMKLPGDYCV